MAPHQRKPYTGAEKFLVIGIDIGTTLSGVSYALLEPGKVPRIQPVTRFPGQTQEKGYSKVPSVVCYDQDRHVIAVGPDTDPEVNPIFSELDDVRRAEWFKLRLRPPHLAADQRSQLEKIWSPGAAEDKDVNALKHEPLDKEKILRPVTNDFKTVVQVFSDFLKYLFTSAEEYIEETERNIDPTFTWASIEKNTYFVLTHPNGWEGKQQSQMRDAAVAAGVVDRSTAANRIIFLTEGEASLHFCLDKIPNLHQVEGGGLLVVDCGGGTVDMSAYSQTENGGYKEIVSPDCLLQGSIFVTSRARDYFKENFRGSQFGSDVGIEAMARAFDKPGGAKCTFRNPNTPYFVKFGGLRDNDRKYGISSGKFKVEGAQMAKFFEPAVQDIISGIDNQCKNAKDGVSIKFVLLVGGFARSDYLYTKLRGHFKSSGIVVLRPDTDHLNKAVADGAVSYYVDRYVSARIAKYSYGVNVNIPFDPADPGHVRRKSTKFTDSDGKDRIPGIFSTILEKGTTVMEEKPFSEVYHCTFTPEQFSQWSVVSTSIKYYKGQATSPPQWLDLEPDSFHDSCAIQVDTTNVKRDLSLQNNGIQDFYRFNCEVVMLFGLTELKAYLAWKENGEEKRSDASIVYYD
ncbi:hypothetical protein M378DRAFT_642370 [Amanita muscaria Koide BX008]|uniref:Uncharacterized protein n=1 Tax=Amanita muscaria (strain Koide BX008) TaxID=946122 RepID=A0A0C2X5M4_AMAMK|nr:hypothetical protein M378DRAFT_642370 [Amanita muscaria Koide BX008]